MHKVECKSSVKKRMNYCCSHVNEFGGQENKLQYNSIL